MEQVSRMTAEVNKLIGGALLSDSAVWLPEIGSLYTEVDAFGSKVITFTEAQQGTPLPEIIMKRAACTPEQSEEIYRRWLEEVRTDNVLKIEGVGALDAGSFVIAAPFAKQLNPIIVTPKAEKTMETTQEPKKKNYTAIVIAIIVLLIAVGGYFAYNAISKSNDEKRAIEAIAAKKAAEKQRAADSIALAQIETQKAADAQAAAKQQTKRYRVVYGVYKLRSNVDEAIRHINKRFGEGSANEYPHGARTLVSMFESDNRNECQRFLMSNYDTYPDTWIYDSEQ